MFLRRGWRQLAVAEAYHDVARRLGLPVDTRGVSLQGHLGVQRIWVGEVMVGHGPDRRMVCWGVLDHERPLGLGLRMRRRPSYWPHLLRRRWEQDQPLERLLDLESDEPTSARALLEREEVRQCLRATLARWREVVVTDDHVQVLLAEPLSRTEDLQALVDDMRALSGALVEARESVPPPGALQAQLAAWSSLADAHGLEVEASYPAAAGAVDGRRIRVWPASADRGFAAEVRVVFRPHRPMGLKVTPQLGPDGYWSVGQDIQVGDAPFDSTFVIKGWDPEAVRDLLNHDAREHLLALHAHGQLEVDDVRLHLRGVRAGPEALKDLLRRAIAAAVALGW